MIRSLLSITLVGSLAATGAAQNYYFSPSDTPTTGTCNVFPWGQSSTRHQHVVTAAELGNKSQTISDIGYAGCNSGTFTAGQITIRMAHVTPGPLNATFASNYATPPVTVLNATNWSYAYTANAWADVGLKSTFNYDVTKGDLLIEVEFCNASGGSSFHRDVSPRVWFNGGGCTQPASGTSSTGALKVRVCTPATGSFTNYGKGCGAGPLTMNGSGTPNIGNMIGYQATKGTANSVGLYILGAQKLAIDLSGLGMPGCSLYTDLLATVLTSFDSNGDSKTWNVTLPKDSALVGGKFMVTAVNFDKNANNAGMVTSDGLETSIGQ